MAVASKRKQNIFAEMLIISEGKNVSEPVKGAAIVGGENI